MRKSQPQILRPRKLLSVSTAKLKPENLKISAENYLRRKYFWFKVSLL